jgi:hypothetical protein
MNNNLMIDIETLGTKPGSVILSIAAVEFDLTTGKIGAIFHQNIDIDSCIEAGLKMQKDTIIWWLNQSKEAQLKVTQHTGNPLRNVLRSFIQWCNDYNFSTIKVWGNSARFDLGILESAFDAFKMPLPWKHYNECDVRTLVMFAPEIKEETEFEGVKHTPVDDCKHQIKYCSAIYTKLKF